MPDYQAVILPRFEGTLPGPQLVRLVASYLARERMFQTGDRVLAAVSGGPDSVALLHLLHRLAPELDLTLAVAHFDHGLRGADSRTDAAFVEELAQGMGLPFFPGQGDVAAQARSAGISLEMAGRRLRLQFLGEARREHGYHKLALGHTADDQVELFWLRLLRGAGTEGLKGMWPATPGGLVRPLLALGKEVLLAWLAVEGIAFRQDVSNLSRRFLRNRIRLDLVPQLLREYNPRLKETIWRTMALFQEDERLLAREAARAGADMLRRPAPGFIALDLASWRELAPALQPRVLRRALGEILGEQEVSGSRVANLQALAQGEKSGAGIRVAEVLVARAGLELHFLHHLPPAPAGVFPLPPAAAGETVSAGGWDWRFTTFPYPPPGPWPPPHQMALMDQEKVAWPLTVRFFRPGDRFWPLGAAGHCKLQDFLVDRKIPRWLRPYLPLVADRERLIWVAGLRVAHEVRLTPDTRTVLQLEFSPAQEETRRIWELLQPYLAADERR